MSYWRSLALLIFFVALTYIYLYPGSEALVHGDTTEVMSDGGDPVPLPYAYDQIVQTFHQNPLRFFYGAVHVPHGDPGRGIVYWMPWSERWIVLLSSTVFPLEQLYTAFVFVLFLINAFAMYGMARAFGWSRWLSLGLAMAWAFNPFTRARAKVHGAMAGIYHLPMIFWALRLVTRGQDRRSLILAALLFLAASTTAHYFLVTALFLSPFYLIYILFTPDLRNRAAQVFARLGVAVLPAMLFLGLNFMFPIPSDAPIERADSFPRGGDTMDGRLHPFLYAFAARPIDYLAGDLGLPEGAKDLNPLREQINESILTDPSTWNAHERTNGIRWSILLITIVGTVWIFLRRSKSDDPDGKHQILFFLLFGLAGLWLSLAPPLAHPTWAPAYWLHSLVSQVRVPSRAGILLHFSCLVVTGLILHTLTKASKINPWIIGTLFAVLMFVDYPPFQGINMSKVQPAYSSLERDKGPCGTGLYFPFVSPYSHFEGLYYFVQKFRRSDCSALNLMQNYGHAKFLIDRFPPTPEFVQSLPTNTRAAEQLVHIATCSPLTWIAFDASVPDNWLQSVCSALGWTVQMQERLCLSPKRDQSMVKFPDECP